MKKFTKGCLITALVLFLLGCGFWIVFGKIGGFQQLDQSGERVYDLGIGGLKFGYTGNSLGFGYWEDKEGNEELKGQKILDASGEKMQTEYTASEIDEIQIEMGGKLVIEESEDEYIWIQNDSAQRQVSYGMTDGCFKLHTGKYRNLFNIEIEDGAQAQVYLYLPKGMKLQNLNVELEGGTFSGTLLEADAVQLEIGAGNLTVNRLNAQDLTISIGAGKAEIDSMQAQNAVIEIGAGDLKMKEFSVESVEMEVGMGNLDADGNIAEHADIQCDMGNVTINLEGKEKDYNYNVECSMGNAKVGALKLSGIAAEHYVDNGSQRFLDVECAMGNVTIRFAD